LNFVWLSLNYFCGASVAILLVGYSRTIDLRFVGVVVPLLLVLYFTFKTSMQRVEDANKHVDQLNTLYLSTIETLAMAVDAKDQVTHGHIRRVQSQAAILASQIGIRDEMLIKAIQAAALLHDIGKLAVPEYILNKPGNLTPVEFEKMKLHAGVGADMLSAIDFPYPVVPIVRHHHENWNGSGYPAGLSGTQIPIGARVLAVVDCFDALTSDRPYRSRLSDDEAFQILLDRRGSMYDPLIVDEFLKVNSTGQLNTTRSGPRSDVLKTIGRSRREQSSETRPMIGRDTNSADRNPALYLSETLERIGNLSGVGEVILGYATSTIPCSLGVFYLYDGKRDELMAAQTSGLGVGLANNLRIGLGQKLSGWVAANRQTIRNSDPILDLGEGARSDALWLRSSLSTSIICRGELLGVLSLYSEQADAFTEEHKAMIEAVCQQIARSLEAAGFIDNRTSAEITQAD
jgi:putative nucleotidyltransferase with HDIG domain